MIRRPPRSTRTDTLFPYTTLFRSQLALLLSEIDDRSTGEITLRRQAIGILLLLALDFFELAISCLSGSICGLECSFTLSQSLHELRIGRSVRLIECSLVAVERVRLVDELLNSLGDGRLVTGGD